MPPPSRVQAIRRIVQQHLVNASTPPESASGFLGWTRLEIDHVENDNRTNLIRHLVTVETTTSRFQKRMAKLSLIWHQN